VNEYVEPTETGWWLMARSASMMFSAKESGQVGPTIPMRMSSLSAGG